MRYMSNSTCSLIERNSNFHSTLTTTDIALLLLFAHESDYFLKSVYRCTASMKFIMCLKEKKVYNEMLLHFALFFLCKLKSSESFIYRKKILNRKDIYVVILFYMYFHPRYAYTKSNLFSNQNPDS